MPKATSVATRAATTTALPGRATPSGTERFRGRHASSLVDDFYRPFATDLVASSIGSGTYLGECDDLDDSRYLNALVRAVRAGANLIDTAINYRCQRSERVVGRAVRDAIHDGSARDEIIICTKGGYIPLDLNAPASRAEYQTYLERTFFEPGIMSPKDVVAGGHCLAPGYIAHQIEASRANLGVETIDLYHLHNPEQQLVAVSWKALRVRLTDAFALLEEQVAAGTIARYGCATWNGLRTPPGEKEHLPLAELVAIAREIAGDGHHFAGVQLPVNLAMTEALRAPTQPIPGGEVVPALDAARALGVTAIASAPLLQGRLVSSLPPAVAEAFPGMATDAQRALSFVRTLPGVTATVAGMRSVAHTEENLASVRRPRRR